MLLLLALAANVLAISVETLDEQVDSKNITILRLRINNETENAFHDVSIKYFVPFNLEQIHLEYVFNSEAGGEL